MKLIPILTGKILFCLIAGTINLLFTNKNKGKRKHGDTKSLR